jgi:hypothetical protein
MIYQLNYGIEYLGLGKVMWYQQKVSTQIARVPRTYVVENKEVPDSNIGVPPVRKYANYRTPDCSEQFAIDANKLQV